MKRGGPGKGGGSGGPDPPSGHAYVYVLYLEQIHLVPLLCGLLIMFLYHLRIVLPILEQHFLEQVVPST